MVLAIVAGKIFSVSRESTQNLYYDKLYSVESRRSQ